LNQVFSEVTRIQVKAAILIECEFESIAYAMFRDDA